MMGATRVKRHRGNCRTISKRRTWDHSSNVSYILALARQVNLGGKRNNGFGKASWDKISMAMDRARPDLKALTKRRNNIQKRLWEVSIIKQSLSLIRTEFISCYARGMVDLGRNSIGHKQWRKINRRFSSCSVSENIQTARSITN